MGQLTGYAQERLTLWRRLRETASTGSLAELFRPAAADLRFRLGTSLADLRIPFKIASSLRRIFAHATIESYSLAAQRYKSHIGTSEYDLLVTTEGFDPSKLRPLAYGLPSAVVREHVRRNFHDAMDGHAGVDAGLVASVMGTDRPGRQLAAAVHALLSKAREEVSGGYHAEPTAYLIALMLRQAAESTFAMTRDAPVTEPMARFVRTATATMLASATHLALREAGLPRLAGLADTPASPDPRESTTALLSLAALGLLPFLGSRPVVGGSGLTAYGVAFEQVVPGLEETMTRLTQTDDIDSVTQATVVLLQRDREVQRRAERLGAFGVLRESCRELARLLDTTNTITLSLPQDGRIDRVLSARDGLERTFASESRRKELVRAVKEAAKSATTDPLRHRLEVLAHAANGYRDDDPAAWLGPAEARMRTARATVALAVDMLIERLVQPASQLLLERTGAETQGGDTEEYESGRLYLVSHEPGPLLRERARVRQEGHLFCDMKDFTRRTVFLKESVIADFLQREFYAPILSAASGLDPGSSAPTSGSGITLNNLLGDAVSFSGDIVALVDLAQSIHTALTSYGLRLEAEGSQESVTSRVTHLEEQHQLRKSGLERTIRDLTARAATLPAQSREPLLLRANEARTELARQTALHKSDLSRASGEKLEAGVFISYGAAPEIARFEDPYFGALKVAVGEKINESARGTARNAAVRDKSEILRRRASMQIGHELDMPFAVLVDTPTSFAVPPEEAMIISDLLARGDNVTAQERLLRGAQQSIAKGAGPGDLYNHGIACSEEAVSAYIAARGDQIEVLRKELPVASLHSQITGRFYIPRDPLQVIACVVPSSRALVQLFIYQGRVLFRGFEATGGLGVYEVVPTRAPLFELFARHHLPQWVKR